jgi:hexosaminidase
MVACQQKRIATPMDLTQESLIPLPQNLSATGSSFLFNDKSIVYYDAASQELKKEATYLSDNLRQPMGFTLNIQASKKTPAAGNVYLRLSHNDSIQGDEGYKLQITEDLIIIEANKSVGIYRGIQTLIQLLPAEIVALKKQDIIWEVASGTIIDAPEYEYRGAMLDVSRHFFDVTEVKKYIDYLAMYKFNVLHLHLSDDQGWRIEIKSWPKLTEIGSLTEVGGGKGGFFTQAQYADIVAYAQARHIIIIPEIDMPGHTNAALASYAELNCDGIARDAYTGTRVGFSSLCVPKEITYTFIDDVIRELAAITPGPYIHIGGDESHSTKLEDYIPFINRVQDIVNKHGKQMIGWDEVQHAALKPSSVAQYWAEAENALGAMHQKAKVIMSPAKNAYLDMQYDSISPLGLHWAGYIEVDTAYNWDPASYVEGIKKEHILGVEAPLWSETVENITDVEYLLFPRLPGYAEIGWTKANLRNWDNYKLRLAAQKARFDALHINYYKSPKVPWAEKTITETTNE